MSKVFISWSEERSKAVAAHLSDWLAYVFPGIDVWMSEHDIQAGARWDQTLSEALELSNLGVLCLTPENVRSAWLIFEAGALSKSVETSRVVPYRFQLRAADIGPPLSQFQSVAADKEGTLKLVASINQAIGGALDPTRLNTTFEHWWDDLAKELESIPEGAPAEQRPEREILEEILETVRRERHRELEVELAKILALPNVQRIEIAPKVIAGQTVNAVALRVQVERKLPLEEIPEEEQIPRAIYGMPTDVVGPSK